MCENLSSRDYHKIQHFISESPWSARELINSVALDINKLFKNEKSVGLLIDESSEEKKGDFSVGVAHQYCGNLGKNANCQVAVFATLSSGDHFSIVDAQLYLPQIWIDDDVRREKAGVPEEVIYKKKVAIALEIIKRLKNAGIRFDYVSADGLYGHDSDFRAGLDDLGILFVGDTHKDTKIYLQEFQMEIPAKKEGSRGKVPTIARPNQKALRVDAYQTDLTAEHYSKEIMRNGCKGALISYVHTREVYVEEGGVCKKRTLVIRKTKINGKMEVHYILANGSLDQYTPAQLAEYESQRFYIEQSFRESKQNIGLTDYQVRGWLAWHHHIAIAMMALAFMSIEKKEHEDVLPLLSYRDIRDAMIDNYLQEEERLPFEERIARRHYSRQRDINRYYKKP